MRDPKNHTLLFKVKKFIVRNLDEIIFTVTLAVFVTLLHSSIAASAKTTRDVVTTVITPNEVVEVIQEETPQPVKTTKPTTKYFDVPLSEDLQDHIFATCEKRNVDPAIIIAMIKKESNYKASNMGDGGDSYGLMQIQPKWHKQRMNALGCTDLLDPYQNVTVGINYFADLCELKGSVTWALMAYNGGPNYANRNTKNGVVSSYASTVLANSEKLERK